MSHELSSRKIPRRSVLFGGAALAVLGGIGAPATPAVADDTTADGYRKRYHEERKRIRPGVVSQNGWPIETDRDSGGVIWTQGIAGTEVKAGLALGAPTAVLGYLIQRFGYDVVQLEARDVSGFRKSHLGMSRASTNLASGTALRIRDSHLVLGRRDGYFPAEERAIRAILHDLEGVVKWGHDLRSPDQGLFYIAEKPGSALLERVAGRVVGTAGVRA